MTKRILATLIVLSLIGFAGYRIWQAHEAKKVADAKAGSKKGGPGSSVVSVAVAKAKSGQVREEILITGSLKPKEQVDVTSKITGRVQRVYVNVGDFVKRGELIAELEDLELQQQVRRAEATQAVVKATFEQRQAELTNAKADLERARQLMNDGLISRQEFEAKQTGYRVVQAQVQLTQAQGEQALAELNELKIRLEQLKVHAPINGQVAQRYVDVGALVTPQTPVARIVNLSTMVTMANVPEREVAKLRVGNRAIVRVDAFGDHEFSGFVARVSPVLDAATRTALVEVEIPNPANDLKAEMFARVTLDLGTMRDAVLIPRQALIYRGQQPGVFILEGDRPRFREIEPGIVQGVEVEVRANLSPGTTIVTRGATMLTEGVRVQIVESAEAKDSTEHNGTPSKRASPRFRRQQAGSPPLTALGR
jgi:RND family efflux transporter MFP subunit